MSKPEYVNVKMRTQTLRVLMRIYGHTSHSERGGLGIPTEINRESANFYNFANRELEAMGYQSTHKEWRPDDET